VVLYEDTMILMPSCTAVTNSCAIIRYEPSPDHYEHITVGTRHASAETPAIS